MCYLPPRIRLDAKKEKPWAIDERNAPTPRAYLALVDKWVRDMERWTLRIYERAFRQWKRQKGRYDAIVDDEGDVISEADAADLGGYLLAELAKEQERAPKPPTVRQVKTTGVPVARVGVRGAVTSLRSVGAPDEVFIRALPMPLKDGQSIRGIDLYEAGIAEQTLEAWATDGVGYIDALQAENFTQLAVRTAETVQGGMRWEDMVSTIEKQYGATRAHARLIAQDQVAKLNAAITKDLNEKAGVTEFKWVATMDARTRQSHRDANGKTFTWKDGAPGVGFYGENGWPGQAGRCRCGARPVPPAWWAAL